MRTSQCTSQNMSLESLDISELLCSQQIGSNILVYSVIVDCLLHIGISFFCMSLANRFDLD